MRLECSVTLDLLDDDGRLAGALRTLSFKRASVELRRAGNGCPATLAIFVESEERPRLSIPLAPPLSLAGKQTSAGLLGLTVRRAKLYPKPCAVTSTASVLLSRCEPAEASMLRDGVVRLMQEGQQMQQMQQQQRNRMMMMSSNQSDASLRQRGGGAALSSKAAAQASASSASAAAAAAAAAASYLPPRSSMIVAHHSSKTPSSESRNKAAAKASFFFSRKFYSPESVAEAEAAAARRAKRLRLEERKNAANLANNGPTLTADQARVLDAILSGDSVFFSGPAGTGKSVVLREAIKRLPAASTFVAAPTGLAAAALGGVTLHAFAGFGAAATKAVEAGNCSGFGGGGTNFNGIAAAVRAASRPRHAARWRSCRVLIVDEVSMVSAALFEALEAAARAVKRSERPFGGIQLVLCGDWLQLPPVVATSAASASATSSATSSSGSSSFSSPSTQRRFAFQAACWERCVPREMLLETVHRQEGDPAFVSLLGRLRVGAASKGEVDELCRKCSRPFEARGARRKSMSSSPFSFSQEQTAAALGVLPTRLLTHRADVEAVNARQLAELDGEEVRYDAIDEGDEALLDGNSSSSGSGSGGVGAWARKSLVLKVGCQVLLTRNVSAAAGLVNGARGVVVGFGRPVCSNSSSFRPPIVRWAASSSTNNDEDDDEEEEPSETEVMRERVAAVAGGRVVAARTQLPLDLAFALSVHKCQGMTLEGPVECSLARAFEPGMAYVALSRVRRLSNLRLVGGIAPAALAADESASAFYARLEGAGGDFVREEQQRGGAGGRASSLLSLSSSLSGPNSSSSSLSLFSRGGDGDSYGGSVDELAGSDSYGSGEQSAALESSRGGREGEDEEAWGAAVAVAAADAVACRPAKKKKRLAERGGLAIDF